jgi:hypothetical protein
MTTPIPRTVWHEAFTLPLLLLSAALLGGMRIDAAGRFGFAPPPLMTLVLAVLLVAVLYRAGALVPERLVHASRSGLENASGLMIVVALVAATAQIVATLTPDGGLLALVFNVAWLVLFGNTLVARPDRRRLLASLLVIFGAAFVVKYVVLGALYAPGSGLTKRVVVALLEGVSLGGLAYQPPGPATGYLAFVAVLLYVGAVGALPRHAASTSASALVVADGVVVDEDEPRSS